MRLIFYNTFYCRGFGKSNFQYLFGASRFMHFSKKSLDIIAGFFQAYTPDIIGIAELKDKPNQVDYRQQANRI